VRLFIKFNDKKNTTLYHLNLPYVRDEDYAKTINRMFLE